MRERAPAIQPYAPALEASWLRCRVLAFLGSSYYDDVVTAKPTYDGPSLELVALAGDDVAGILDISIADDLATIETIATHPDHGRRGTGRALLDHALPLLPADVATVDAWTRDDPAANGWYQANGFTETFRYLHVYATSDDELTSAIPGPRTGLTPAGGFFHAPLEHEAVLRAEYRRVHICRRYERPL